jgi:hypothetical protein
VHIDAGKGLCLVTLAGFDYLDSDLGFLAVRGKSGLRDQRQRETKQNTV